jgi:precorrin-6B methylase 2
MFDLLGLGPDDELVDLFSGSGAVTTEWNRWRNELRLAA